jgi:hypothetical protein
MINDNNLEKQCRPYLELPEEGIQREGGGDKKCQIKDFLLRLR